MRNYHTIINAINRSKSEISYDIIGLIGGQLNLSPSIVKKGIKQGVLRVNGKIVTNQIKYLNRQATVTFQNTPINLRIFDEKSANQFDSFILAVKDELKIDDLTNIPSNTKEGFCAYVIEYFCNNSYSSVEPTVAWFELAFHELELFYRDHFKERQETKIPKRKELIEILVKKRTDKLRELNDLTSNLLSDIFSKNLFRFLQEYNKVITSTGFAHCIAPLLPTTIYSKPVLEALIKPITESYTKHEIDQKYIHFDSHKDRYVTFLQSLDKTNELQEKIFREIASFLYSLFRKECETLELKTANVEVKANSRKYNFQNTDRKEQDLLLVVRNIGEGLAREIQIISESPGFSFEPRNIGVLKPGESIDISIAATVHFTDGFVPLFNGKCVWVDSSSRSEEHIFELQFQVQDVNIPWEQLQKNKPYTIQEIEVREKLYGRDEILKELESNIRSSNIESYKIWGQKRVGKSSIVKTLRSLFSQDEKIIVVWRSIAGLKNTDPLMTLNTLGESLCVEIFEELDLKIKHPSDRERIRAIEVPEFKGSLFPLENYLKQIRRVEPSLKFVIILDEFDRINEEFFLPGNLGDTFSLNIGKGISSSKFVGFILVGSENMHLLDRQEINYNSFQEREIDTFNKQTEYESFKNIIIGPVSPYINYSAEAIEQIFSVTNGNPYFANLICSYVFKTCIQFKDNYVDLNTANKAVDYIVESSQKSHFEHFWADGITDESNIKKEKKSDIRRRVLVSYSFVYFQEKKFPTRTQIVKSFKRPLEYVVENYEIENTITEFFNRKIFYEDQDASIRIKPSLFESWLCGLGRTLMIEGVSDLEALQREKQLEVEHALKQEEINRIISSYLYKGRPIDRNSLIQYFNQFGGPLEQRRIFKIVDSLLYISKDEIQDFFKREQKNIFRKSDIELRMGARTPYREFVEIYSFSNSLAENEDIVGTFKVLTHIRSTKTLKDIIAHKDAWKVSGADDIVIFDCVIDDFSFIQADLLRFLDDKAVKDRVLVKLVVLVITTKAKSDLIKATSGYSNFKLIPFREVEEGKVKPFIKTTEIFETEEESSYAFSEAKKHLATTSREGLNIVFETHCPSRSLQILWYKSSTFQPLFHNETAVRQLNNDKYKKEELRTRLYHANTELSQHLNVFIINFLRDKAAKDDRNWFHVDFLPSKIMNELSARWIDEGQKHPLETYLNFIHYKEIIKKHSELLKVFQFDSENLNWCERLNVLRRDPAHPEKPGPLQEDVDYFERVSQELIKRMNSYDAKLSSPI